MHPHYVVVYDFVDSFGAPHKRGEVIVVGDSTPIEGVYEITHQVVLGNLVEVPAGEGVVVPGSAKGIAEES